MFGSAYKTNWNEAKTACEAIGAHLAVITSYQENTFLNKRNGWIGLNDEVKEGTWVWVDGSVLSYKNWDSGQPSNNNNNQHCGFRTSNGKWNDFTCSTPKSYICESPTS